MAFTLTQRYRPGILSFIVLLCLLHGFYYYSVFNQYRVHTRFTAGFTGVIVSIPVCLRGRCQFDYRVRFPQRYRGTLWRVSWYGQHPALSAGQVWQWTLRVLTPKPGSSRLRLWAYPSVARAYVSEHAPYRLMGQARHAVVIRWRQRLLTFIHVHVPNAHLAAVLAALTVGDRALMRFADWRVFTRTGTGHLIAISGLHIGLVAMAFYNLFLFIARRWLWWQTRLPAPHVAAIAAWLAAVVYSVLAGLSFPTQRALIMCTLLFIPSLFYRYVPLWRRLWLAFLVIVLCEPFALLQAGFWLSFVAVGSLAFVLRARIKPFTKTQQAWRVHMAVTLGLLPLSLWFFSQLSLVAPLANAVAIPWVTLVVVPVALLACLCYGFSAPLASALFHLAAALLWPLWWYLHSLSQWSWANWQHVLPNAGAALIGMLGALLVLSPLPRLTRLWGAVLLLWMLLC